MPLISSNYYCLLYRCEDLIFYRSTALMGEINQDFLKNKISTEHNYSALVLPHFKNRSKGPVLIGLEEIVQRQVGVGVGRGR